MYFLKRRFNGIWILGSVNRSKTNVEFKNYVYFVPPAGCELEIMSRWKRPKFLKTSTMQYRCFKVAVYDSKNEWALEKCSKWIAKTENVHRTAWEKKLKLGEKIEKFRKYRTCCAPRYAINTLCKCMYDVANCIWTTKCGSVHWKNAFGVVELLMMFAAPRRPRISITDEAPSRGISPKKFIWPTENDLCWSINIMRPFERFWNTYSRQKLACKFVHCNLQKLKF